MARGPGVARACARILEREELDAGGRMVALAVLWSGPADAMPTQDVLRRLVKQGPLAVSLDAVSLMQRCDEDRAGTAEWLTGAFLEDPDGGLADCILEVILNLGADAAHVAARLGEYLRQRESGVTDLRAARGVPWTKIPLVLASIAPRTSISVEVLFRYWHAMEDESYLFVASRVDRETAMDAMIDSLGSDDGGVRALCALQLAAFGTDATKATPRLLSMLETERGEGTIQAAVSTLAVVCEDRWMLSERAIDLTRSERYETRCAACTLLGLIGVGSDESVGALRRCLEDEDLDVREAAEVALERLGKGATR